jgi:hypothetical protein
MHGGAVQHYAIIEIWAAFRPKADDLPPNRYSRSLKKRSLGLPGQQGGSWATAGYGYTSKN